MGYTLESIFEEGTYEMTKGLSKTQLQIIAIIAMVCDHYAWGFVDFFSVPGQILHIIGRLTIPIMCFFIAEGFQRTSSLRKYICRMVIFWLVSMVPFYLFFHEVYGYRQNIIFDLLLGLLLLAVLENRAMPKWQKVIFTTFLFLISGIIGGWPILPMLFILIFYYKKDFASRAKWFCAVNIVFITLLIIAIRFNEIYHFSPYNWVWYDKLYQYGFMLALLPLSRYNGERGNYPMEHGSGTYSTGRYFFYLFYPLHFLVLFGLQCILANNGHYVLYLGLHIFALVVSIITIAKMLMAHPSRAQASGVFFGIFAIIYLVGFLLEITTDSLPAICTAITVEYVGELFLFVGVTMFMAEFSHFELPKFVYIVEVLMSCIIIFLVFTAPQNHIYYREMYLDYSGPFPRITLEYGPGFVLFVAYAVALCVGCFIMCIQYYCQSSGIELRRISCIMLGIVCPWVPIALRLLGLTGGYEISALGVLGADICLAMALLKYGYLDSIQLARENALNHGNEGILVISPKKRILYFNRIMQDIFPDIRLHKHAYTLPYLKDILENDMKSLSLEEKVYEMRIEPLIEAGYVQGNMLWAIDMTEHYKQLRAAENSAHTDALTGLNNRSYFRSCLSEHVRLGGIGAMMMLDLDDFKHVNDNYGHGAGDLVLITLSDTIKKVARDTHLSCRMGGDEFSIFFKDITDTEELTALAKDIIYSFKHALSKAGYANITSVSVGIAIIDEELLQKKDTLYDELYRKADRALYVSKNSGKDVYRFYS